MIELPPWSYSSLEKFENCPKQWYHKYILKEKEPDTVHTRYGTLVHTGLENRMRDKTPLPNELRRYETMASSIEKSAEAENAELFVELEMAVDKEFKPVGFWDEAVWGRGKLDIGVKNGPKMWIGDWKTGKVREKAFQVSVFAAFLFKLFLDLEEIHANNIWLQSGRIGESYRFTRQSSEAPVWQEIMRKIGRIELAAERGRFDPKQSGLCAYCPVKSCAYNPNKE
jgi:RecB family exonuclease